MLTELYAGGYAYFFEVIAKTTVTLAVCAAGVAVAPRMSAACRHLVWSLALAVCMLMPVAGLLPHWSIAAPPELGALWSEAAAITAAMVADEPHALGTETVAGAVPVPGIDPGRLRSSGPELALALWAIVAAGLCLRLLIGLARAHQLVARGQVLDLGLELERCVRELEVDRQVKVVESRDLCVPMTCGTFRPVLLVPAGFASWPQQRRRLVLEHELAHIRRTDFLIQLAAQLTTSVYWFHPLAWFADNRLRLEAEKAADDLVLGLGTRATDYAEHLLAIVRSLSPTRSRVIGSVAMADRSFEERVSAILEPNRRRGPMPRIMGIAAGSALVLGLSLIATMQVSAVPVEHKVATIGDTHRYARNGPCESLGRARELYAKQDYAGAVESLEQAVEQGFATHKTMFNLACCYSLMKDADQATHWLERAVEAGSSPDLLESDPDLAFLRSDPRYRRLLDRHRETEPREQTARDQAESSLAPLTEWRLADRRCRPSARRAGWRAPATRGRQGKKLDPLDDATRPPMER